MTYQYQSSPRSARADARDPQARALGDMDPEMASVLDHYATQGPDACAAALDSFPENERARCWAYLQRTHGNAFVAQATEGRELGTPTADPGIVAQLFESVRQNGPAAAAWLRHSYPEPFWQVYATAVYEYAMSAGGLPRLKAEALLHRVLGREGPAAACEEAYRDELLSRAAALSSWKEDDSDLAAFGERTDDAAQVAQQQAPEQATTAIDAAEQAALEADIAHLIAMLKSGEPSNAADYEKVSAAAMQLQRWRARFPAAQDDASFSQYPGFNPHMELLRVESTSRAWIRRAHEAQR